MKCITALVTPLCRKDKIDKSAFLRLIENQYSNGIDTFVLFGTTGEGSLLDNQQKLSMLKLIKKKYPSLNIYLGISKITAKDAIQEIMYFDNTNIKGYLVLTPFYFKTSEQGIIEHYQEIAAFTTKEILIYDVPKRTGQVLTMGSIKILSSIKNIVGIKYADANIEFLKELLKIRNDNFKVYIGEDLILKDCLNLEIDGIVSVCSNAFPRLVKWVLDNHLDKRALSLLEDYQMIWKVLFIEPNPIMIKYYLAYQKRIKEIYQKPLISPSLEDKDILFKEYMEDIDENYFAR